MAACRLEAVRAGHGEHRRGRVEVDAERAAAYPLEEVDDREPESHPHDLAGEREGKLVPRVPRGFTDERLVVGVAADDLVQDDDVGGSSPSPCVAKSSIRRSLRPLSPASSASSSAYGS